VVNDNTNTKCFFAVDTNLLQLSKGETTALADLTVVSDGLGSNGGAEESKGTDTKGGSLGLTGIASTEFATGLVEPGTYPALPVFAEMVGVEYVVVRETHGLVLRTGFLDAEDGEQLAT
jgi:hypothetical protein